MTRSGADALDDVDRRGYGQALKPVQDAVLSGRLKANDGPLWEIRFAIRNAKFRMTYEELGAAVKKALKLPEPSAPIDARNVVRAPSPPSHQIPSADAPSGAWMAHLSPSEDAERDAFLVDILARTEAAMGAGMAVACAQRVVAVRQALEAEREEQRRQRLLAIPEDDRDEYLRRAGGDVVKAVRLYVAKQRQRMGQDGYSQWRNHWARNQDER